MAGDAGAPPPVTVPAAGRARSALDRLTARFPGGKRGAAVAGVGAVALVAFVLSHRGSRSVGSASSRSAGTTAPAPETETPYAVASTYPNTYATDLASALGGLDSRYAENLATWQKQTGSTTDALKAAQAKQQKTLTQISKDVAALRKVGATAPPKKAVTKAPRGSKPRTVRTYTIRRGDTLGAIAKRYNTSVSAIARANKIANPNVIRAGAKLTIPS